MKTMNTLENTLDEFTAQYIETALWSSTDDSDDYLDENYSPDDLSPETLERIKQDCQLFQQKHGTLIAADPARAGHDFWLTRNRHGAGFWDGDWEHGDALTKASDAFGEIHLYVGDDGLIYQL